MGSVICAGNWKLNKGPRATGEFVAEFLKKAQESELQHFALFAPALSLYVLSEAFRSTAVNWGAQNCYYENSGAFTGENSAEVLKEMGATHTLVGHSERRQLFGETNADVAKKIKNLLQNEITPVLCLGETLKEREAGHTNDVVLKQMQEGLIHWDSAQPLWVAYEPVWAIGTGKVATPEQAGEVHSLLRQEMGEGVPLLYGGSVKPDNAFDLAQQKDVDGFLVGGASLKVDDFLAIFANGNKAKE